MAPALYTTLDVDPLKAFVPVAKTALLPHVLVVSNDLPVKSVEEFIAYAKQHPGKLNYGAGLGTPPHLLSTLFKTKADIDAVYVPYKGSAASVTDLLAGRVDYQCPSAPTASTGIDKRCMRNLRAWARQSGAPYIRVRGDRANWFSLRETIQ